ncbi:MAG: hypothetical protein HWD59_08500 [Coxiellaceae bacterium]|nr:MAG: hypothetical protein HWD59_08500 [Coxiellaceae bacterium]
MTKWQKLMAMANMLIRDVHPGDMILIGGPARVGKSTLATALKYALLDKNYTTKVLRLDNWLKSESERADQGVMNRYRLSDAEAFILQGLQKPGVYRMPFYDRYYRETIPAAVDIEFAADDVLVIEGVVALMSVPLVNRASKRIYLSCPETVRWQNFQQEYYARGLATDDIKTLYQSRLIDENPVVETVKPLADAVISELYLGAADAIN